MATIQSARTGNMEFDFPTELCEFFGDRRKPTEYLLVVFLFKLASSDRETVMEQIVNGGADVWSERYPRPNPQQIPWLRASTCSINDVPEYMCQSQKCIFIDKDVFEQGRCFVMHRIQLKGRGPRHDDCAEYASVRIDDALSLFHPDFKFKSWFPEAMPQETKLEIVPRPVPEITPKDLPEIGTAECPIFVTTSLTSEQQTYLLNLMSGEFAEPTFIHLPNESSKDNMDFLMQYFLDHSWFPTSFAIIDSTTVATIPVPIPTTEEEDPMYAEFDPPYPTFTLATELSLRHHSNSKEDANETTARDILGYASGQRQWQEPDEFGNGWCSVLFRGMGLRSYLPWVDPWNAADEDENEKIDRYYWGCWLDENGRVDGQVRAEENIAY